MSNEFESLGEALFGRIRRELLSVFLLNPDSSYYLLQLVRILDTGRGGVQRELKNLVNAGVVKRERSGIKVMFSLSGDCPAAEELSVLMGSISDFDRMMESLAEHFRDDLEVMVCSSRGIPSSGSDTRILAVCGEGCRNLAEELERAAVLCGRSISFEILDRAEAESRVLNDVSIQWIFDDSAVFLAGSRDELRTDEIREPGDDRDLFSSAGVDW